MISRTELVTYNSSQLPPCGLAIVNMRGHPYITHSDFEHFGPLPPIVAFNLFITLCPSLLIVMLSFGAKIRYPQINYVMYG